MKSYLSFCLAICINRYRPRFAGKVNKLLADIKTDQELSDLERALKEIQKAVKIKRSELQQST